MKSWIVFFVICLLPGSRLFAQATPEAAATEEREALAKIQAEPAKAIRANQKAVVDAQGRGDAAWMMVSTGLVLLMVPGLALFYGGMVRRKNILATMMQSMIALAVVGVYWVAIGYALAFGKPLITFGDKGSLLGFDGRLLFMHGVEPGDLLPGTNIPVYLHMLFQGMFAIITPALISGALAERIRFKPYCLFLLVWVTLIYCPLAHAVWAMNWWDGDGTSPVGLLAKMGALDFAGGTVVHIAAGFSSLAAILVLRKRHGYPEHAMHPSSMVLTLTGAGLLWFGWFGFNGGSAGGSTPLAVAAMVSSQAAAAAAGLSWILVEWLHRGKPTALGLASGFIAGLVAVTPASGYVYPWSGLVIGLFAGVVCYVSVSIIKPAFRYDDSLDAFGVHGVGGFFGAVITGLFCSKAINPAGQNGLLLGGGGEGTNPGQVWIQFVAALVSALAAFVLAAVIIKLLDLSMGFTVDEASEIAGLDRAEHGETGFDLGLAQEATAIQGAEPRPAAIPPQGKRFQIVVEGLDNGALHKAWSNLWQPDVDTPAEFKSIYPNFTTVTGNRFQFRGGDPEAMRANLLRLLQHNGKPLRARIEA